MGTDIYHYDYESMQMPAEGSTHQLALDRVRPGSQVIDLGSGPGHMARLLDQKGCSVTCVEGNPEAGAKAREWCKSAIIADLESGEWCSAIQETPDFVLLLDVLEHMKDPTALLKAVAELMGADTELIVTVPNVSHAAIRLPLLRGEWSYEQQGLLDVTHLRFFTREGLLETIASAGLEPVEIRAVMRGVSDHELDPTAMMLGVPKETIENLLKETDGFVFQWVVFCRAAVSAESTVPVSLTLERSYDVIERCHVLEGEIAHCEQRVQAESSARRTWPSFVASRYPRVGGLARGIRRRLKGS